MKIMKTALAMEANEEINNEQVIELNRAINEDFLSIQEQMHQYDGLDDQVNEASAVADTLTTMTEHIGSVDNLNEHEANAINVAVEHFCKRLGYKYKVYVSLEGHGVCTRNSVVALEGFVSSIWEAIKAAFRKLKEWALAAWNAVFGKSKSVDKKADAVSKQRAEVKKDVPASEHDRIINEFNDSSGPSDTKNEDTKPNGDSFSKLAEKVQGTIYGEKALNFFRREDGKGCYSPEEIEKKSHNLLEEFSSGVFLSGFEKFSKDIDEIKDFVDDFFNSIDRVSEAYSTNNNEMVKSCLDTFTKISEQAIKNFKIGEVGQMAIRWHFDSNYVIADNGSGSTYVKKEPFKELAPGSVLKMPTSSLKDKILDTVLKLEDKQENGKIKKTMEKMNDLFKYVDSRLDRSSSLHNSNLKSVNDEGLKKEAEAFGRTINNKVTHLKGDIKNINDLMLFGLDLGINTLNTLLDYVRLSDRFVVNEYGESSFVI